MAESGAPGADSATNPAYSIFMVAEGENETLAMPGENPGQVRILEASQNSFGEPGQNLRLPGVGGAVSSPPRAGRRASTACRETERRLPQRLTRSSGRLRRRRRCTPASCRCRTIGSRVAHRLGRPPDTYVFRSMPLPSGARYDPKLDLVKRLREAA